MKAAFLGTTDYHTTMQQVAHNALQPRLYKMLQSEDVQFELPPVADIFTTCADMLIQRVVGTQSLVNCNPRVPYLLLAWTLVSQDNRHRVCQHLHDTSLSKHVALLNLRIALGNLPALDELLNFLSLVEGVYNAWDVSSEDFEAMNMTLSALQVVAYISNGYADVAGDTIAEMFNADIAYFPSDLFSHNQIALWKHFNNQIESWAYITDEEAGLIARQLLFDILDTGK